MATLGSIIDQIRNRADLLNSQFITDDEMTQYTNFSLGELYGLLVNSFGGNYFATTFTGSVPANGTQMSGNMPDDLYKILGVDLQISPYPSNNKISLTPYNFNERNRANALNLYGYATQYATNYRYNIFNQTLLTQPPAAGPLQLLVWYVPTAPQFYLTTSGVVTTSPSLSTGVVAIIDNTFVQGQAVQKLNSVGLPSGTTWYVIAVSGNNITLGATEGATTGTNLTGLITPGNTLFSSTLNYTQTFVNNTNLDNWLEYVIVDVCIKCKTKEDTDTSMFVRQKALLTDRIRNEAQNRDIGSPPVVSDIYAAGTIVDTGWGSMGSMNSWTY
jgi:hypothetical protein